ncbi:hypothetical protein B0H15DRAFT_806595 [Mycena belliarum]|uniref:Uncharacterized protein n=1 Tax=Mycena belliarum TaxID=1033014 RepID=A0AAD6TPF6_9AGAR|nr:hypothetical protein B0H15DRAFT_806595 [Mycena belliae]
MNHVINHGGRTSQYETHGLRGFNSEQDLSRPSVSKEDDPAAQEIHEIHTQGFLFVPRASWLNVPSASYPDISLAAPTVEALTIPARRLPPICTRISSTDVLADTLSIASSTPSLEELPGHRGHVHLTPVLPARLQPIDVCAPVENNVTRKKVPFRRLLPPAPPSTSRQEVIEDVDAHRQYRRRAQTLLTQQGPSPSPLVTLFLRKGVQRREVATIRSEVHTTGEAIFQLQSNPWQPLQEGVVIECVGALSGDWKVTHWMEREGPWMIMIWISLTTTHFVLARAPLSKVRSGGLVSRARILARSLSRLLVSRKPPLEALAYVVEVEVDS